MTRNPIHKSFGMAMIALLIASAAMAAGPVRGDFEQTYKMETTDEGTQFGAFGYVQLERRNGIEAFGLRVFAKLPDRSNLIVEVRNDLGRFEVGTIEMFLGSGSLQLSSATDPSPAFPLAGVDHAEVRDSQGRLLVQIDFDVFQPAPGR